jgi:hypothetical protein
MNRLTAPVVDKLRGDGLFKRDVSRHSSHYGQSVGRLSGLFLTAEPLYGRKKLREGETYEEETSMSSELEITVIGRTVYGNELVYPACEKARAFAQLMGKKTLSPFDLKVIKESLGYSVKIAGGSPHKWLEDPIPSAESKNFSDVSVAFTAEDILNMVRR